MPRNLHLLLALAAAAWCAPFAAAAQSITCSFSTGPTPMAFSYDPAATTPTSSSATFTLDCTNGRPVTVQLSTGAGTFGQRQLVQGADRLSYNLYTTAGYTTVWGDGTPPSQARSLRRGTYTIYGQIPPGQWVAAGSYSDTITVTVLY